MKSWAVGELKGRFSEALAEVQAGHALVVTFGRNHRKVAVLSPYKQYCRGQTRTLGILRKSGSFKMTAEAAISDEELLNS